MCSFPSCDRYVLKSVMDFWMLLFQMTLEGLSCPPQPFLQMHTHLVVLCLRVDVYACALLCAKVVSPTGSLADDALVVLMRCVAVILYLVSYCGGEGMWSLSACIAIPVGKNARAPWAPHTVMCNVLFLFLGIEENCWFSIINFQWHKAQRI